MKTQALLVLLCATAALARFDTGGDFCDDEKKRHDTCKPLVNHAGCHCSHEKSSSHEGSHGSHEGSHGSHEIGSGSGSGSGSGFNSSVGEGSGSGVESGSGSGSGSEWQPGDLCFILQIFWEFSFELDIELQLIFQEWINITQVTIVEDVTLTEYEIIVELYYSLQILFEAHVEIKQKIQYQYIGDWGYVCDLEGLSNDIQTEDAEISAETVITIVGGTCPLFDGLDECGQNASSSDQAAIKALIADLTVIIKGSFTFQHKLTLIYAKFVQYSAQYPNLPKLFKQGKIHGFGVLQSFFDMCAVYWRIDNFDFAIGGTVSNCKLIQALVAWYSNSSSGYSTSQRSDIKGLSDKLSNYFSSESDVQLRIEYFQLQLYQFYILENWTVSVIYDINISGYGNLYQLIYAFVYCTNNGIGQGEFTESTTSTKTSTSTSTSTTTTKTSTSTSTTTTTKPTTTTTKPTTTTPSGNCATVTSVNVVSNNITLLLTAIVNDQKTTHWNDTLIANFNGYKNKIWVISTNSSSSATVTNKFNAIKTVLTGFTTKADFKAIVMAIFIQGWGTIQQYCNCVM